QQLARRRRLESAFADRVELLAVVGDSAAGSAEREARANDRRKADVLLDAPCLVERVRDRRTRRTQPDARHRLLELLAVFGLVDRRRRRADQLDRMPLQ